MREQKNQVKFLQKSKINKNTKNIIKNTIAFIAQIEATIAVSLLRPSSAPFWLPNISVEPIPIVLAGWSKTLKINTMEDKNWIETRTIFKTKTP